MRALNNCLVLIVMFVVGGIAAPVRAQTDVYQPPRGCDPIQSSDMPAFRTPFFVPTVDFDPAVQQPAGPPPTPRHTGIKALTKGTSSTSNTSHLSRT